MTFVRSGDTDGSQNHPNQNLSIFFFFAESVELLFGIVMSHEIINNF